MMQAGRAGKASRLGGGLGQANLHKTNPRPVNSLCGVDEAKACLPKKNPSINSESSPKERWTYSAVKTFSGTENFSRTLGGGGSAGQLQKGWLDSPQGVGRSKGWPQAPLGCILSTKILR